MRIIPREILYWKHRGIKDQFSVGLLKFFKFHRNLLSWNYLLIIVAHLCFPFSKGKMEGLECEFACIINCIFFFKSNIDTKCSLKMEFNAVKAPCFVHRLITKIKNLVYLKHRNKLCRAQVSIAPSTGIARGERESSEDRCVILSPSF